MVACIATANFIENIGKFIVGTAKKKHLRSGSGQSYGRCPTDTGTRPRHQGTLISDTVF